MHSLAGAAPARFQGDTKKKTLASLLAAATIALTLTATDVSAQWRRRGWGWGPGVAAGVLGGAVIPLGTTRCCIAQEWRPHLDCKDGIIR